MSDAGTPDVSTEPAPTETVVVYLDETEERVKLSLRSLIEVERRWKGLAPYSEGVAFSTWWSLGKPGLAGAATKKDKVDKAFDEWMDRVERIRERPIDVDPSGPAPSVD